MTEPVKPNDFQQLYDAAANFWHAQPANRVREGTQSHIIMQIDGQPSHCVAIVISHLGITFGLAIYPVEQLPHTVLSWQAGDDLLALPPGCHAMYLNFPAELPEEDVARAYHHGWPREAGVIATFVTYDDAGPVEIGEAEALQITTALQAVTAHTARGKKRRFGFRRGVTSSYDDPR
jgi:hypothetical protein